MTLEYKQPKSFINKYVLPLRTCAAACRVAYWHSCALPKGGGFTHPSGPFGPTIETRHWQLGASASDNCIRSSRLPLSLRYLQILMCTWLSLIQQCSLAQLLQTSLCYSTIKFCSVWEILLGEKVEMLIIYLYSMKITPCHTHTERHIHSPTVWKVLSGQLPWHNPHNAECIMGNMESELDTQNRGMFRSWASLQFIGRMDS